MKARHNRKGRNFAGYDHAMRVMSGLSRKYYILSLQTKSTSAKVSASNPNRYESTVGYFWLISKTYSQGYQTKRINGNPKSIEYGCTACYDEWAAKRASIQIGGVR
jgi:hypothetical protein